MRFATCLSILVLFVSSGCASNANSDSPDYQAGYSDGCASGSAADSYSRHRVIRDEHAFRHNPDYKAGWRSGYNACVVKSGGGDPFGRERERSPF
jgi:hypothetical protein